MTPLLMIPGPIEIAPSVVEAYSVAPPSHLAPHVIEAHGGALTKMRQVWLASADSQPFAIAGSGTLAMEMAATNLVERGDDVLLVNTGYFSDRMAEMLRRRGASIVELGAPVGDAPSRDALADALSRHRYKAVFATHVDTSTGVRVDARSIAQLAREHGALSVFDGVCATAGERFEMEAWGADVYLTASQKAIGLPVGLALLVASTRALAVRTQLGQLPPMSIDFEQWLPIMRAYEQRQPSYFSTPATNLMLALDVSLGALLANRSHGLVGMEACFALHQRAADAMRAAWQSMSLDPLCKPELAANTLSALRFPEGVDGALVHAIKKRGVVVAGGLHPSCRGSYFRVGHMGDVVHRPDALLQTVEAVGHALGDVGKPVDVAAARAAAAAVLGV